jgi:uncharacterized GH25 family protein
MLRYQRTKTVWFLLLALVFVAAVQAHDLYLLPVRFLVNEGEVISAGLHNGDAFPESEVSPVLERVRDMKLVSATGSVDVQDLHVSGNSVEGEVRIPASGAYVLIARTVPHAFQLSAKDFNAYLNEEGLTNALKWRKEHGETERPGRERYAKYAKALLTTGISNEIHTRPINFELEIVPQLSPYELKPGDGLPISVLLKGKPAVDLQVETSWAGNGSPTKTMIIGNTDREGKIVVPNLVPGRWRIHTVVMEPCPDVAAADWESRWASLTFEIR